MDYVEGNSRMIIYNNNVEVRQLCMAKKRSFHVLECFLNNARSRSTSTQTKVRVKRFVHVVLHVDVLDQLLLLGEAPHTVCALPQLSFWPCWLSFIRILRWSANNCPELDQLWDWSYPDSGLVSWTEIPHLCQTLSQSFSVPGLSFLCLSTSTSTSSIGFVIWTLSPFLPVS